MSGENFPRLDSLELILFDIWKGMGEFNANYFVGEDRIGYETSSRFLSVRYRCEIDICSYKLREDGNTILIDAFFFFF